MKTNDKKTYKVYLKSLQQWVEVTQEQYRDFYHDINNYRINARNHKLCNCPWSKAWLCDMDCWTCQFRTTPTEFSLDLILEDLNTDETEWTNILGTPNADIQSIVEDQQLLETLLLKLELLTSEERQICELLLGGYNEREIAEIMGFNNQSAVNYRKKNAFKVLKLELKDYR